MFLVINFETIKRAREGPMSVIINDNIKSIAVWNRKSIQIMNVYDKYTTLEFESEEDCLDAYNRIIREIDKRTRTTVYNIEEK